MTMFARTVTDWFGHLCLGGKADEHRVNHWPNNSSDNVGHRQYLITVVVLLGRVHEWLPTEIDEHLRET